MQGIYPIFAEGNVNIFDIPGPKCREEGAANSRCITHECVRVHGLHVLHVSQPLRSLHLHVISSILE